MKKTIINVSLAFLVGLIFTNCGSQNKAETNNVKVVCDSVDTYEYDANGAEFIVKKLRCDTIKENVSK
jgi:hypothetical protein